ncbi:OmpA family protein [Mangrovivirga cuniculi]|uniref:OmpA-like domain-containing protein n=1 Tax=Mangrovivirga cuniculi TaxID=2715131 RepID=A0A4D7JP67_9BACT|nr:OmpA family protein [Mangrovivirga cuniculi]QCK16447.1 hypothetical protein DCC35_17790 [Mangrovivirga cuniculi]
MKYNFLTFTIFILFAFTVNAQQGDVEKTLYRADQYFKIENYNEALKYYEKAVEMGADDAVSLYRYGVTLSNLIDVQGQKNALEHLEKAIKKDEGKLPVEKYWYLGLAELRNENPVQAIESFNKFLDEAKPNNNLRKKAALYKEMAFNAQAFLANPKLVELRSFSSVVNSDLIEYNPVISADESVMAYTVFDPVTKGAKEKIFIVTKKDDGTWGKPEEINIKTTGNIGTAGISADGRQLLVFVGNESDPGDLYTIHKIKGKWQAPVSLGKNINSRYTETAASLTSDGKTIYFASNRPGSIGGFDIYKSEKNEKGVWGQAKNLGPVVNTEQNEEGPFIHPDQRTLFFTSEGHKSMGGRDIFRTVRANGEWQTPVNLGYPINTTTDDNYFTLSADGETGYFSSDRVGGQGGQDIYFFDMPEGGNNIALTLIKGLILDGDTKQPISSKIKVVEKNSGNKVEYVYSPNEKGEYLIIFPPGKSYDLIVESENYLPYTIAIDIPDQEYFYELYQRILLTPIKQFDVVVGQEVKVSNVFYDTENDTKISPRMANEANLIKSDSLDLLDIMDGIIATSDTIALDYLMTIMFATNPVEEFDFDDSSNDKIQHASQKYYYDENGEESLEKRIVDGEPIFSLPTFNVSKKALKEDNDKISGSEYDESLLNKKVSIYFNVGDASMQESDKKKLAEMLKLIDDNPVLGLEISGYASQDGDEETNRKLSNERAKEVLNYFNTRGIVRRRIIAKGYGAVDNSNLSKEESRRVDVRIVDLNKEQSL